MALVGKAGAGSDFSQPRPLFPNKLDRALQSEMHDVAMRCHADGSRKHPREMEWAAPCNIRERLDPDRLIEMSDDVVPEPPEQVFTQHAARPGWQRRGVGGHQPIDKAARHLVPGEGSAWIIVYALEGQGASARSAGSSSDIRSISCASGNAPSAAASAIRPGSTATRRISTSSSASAAQSNPAGLIVSDPTGRSRRTTRPAIRRSTRPGDIWKQMQWQRGVVSKCMAPSKRTLRTETPLSPGALPAARVVGPPPSCCAMQTLPMSTMISARIKRSRRGTARYSEFGAAERRGVQPHLN